MTKQVVAVEVIFMKGRRESVAKIAELVGISSISAYWILLEHLNMNKGSTEWFTNFDSRHTRVICVNELLQLRGEDSPRFFARIVTADESWIHHYDHANQWNHPNSPTPKRPLQSRSAGKIMMAALLNENGVLLLDFLPCKETVTGIYYNNLINFASCH